MRWIALLVVLGLVLQVQIATASSSTARLAAMMEDEPALVETEVDAEVDAEAAMEANIAELEESMTELRSNIAVQQAFMTAPEAPAITPPPAPPPPPPTYGGREPEPKKPAPYAKYEAIVLSGVPALTKKQIWEAQQKVVKVDAYREKLHGITRDVEIINR